jgi:hypothetical protein
MEISGAVRCLRCSFFDRLLSEAGDMLPLPPYAIPIPVQQVGFLGVTRPDTHVPICHQVLVDFDGPQGTLVVYIPKAEIFPNHKRANEYIPEKPVTTYGPDRKTRFVNASQVIERLSGKDSGHCKDALKRIFTVMESVEHHKLDLFRLWQNNIKGLKPVGSCRDNAIAALHELAKEFPDTFHQELNIILAKFGKSLVSEKQARGIMYLDFPSLVRNTGDVFGLRDQEAAELAAARASGKRTRINDTLVPVRKQHEARFDLLLPSGKPWDFHLACKKSSGTHNATLQRILLISANVDNELVSRLKKIVPEDQCKEFGVSEQFGCSAVQLDEHKKPVKYADAVTFFTKGFYAVTLHATRTLCKKTRQAIYSGKGSLYNALMEYSDREDPALQADLNAYKKAWVRLFDVVENTFYVAQVSASENAVLPTAFEVIKMMHSLCNSDKTPVNLLMRAILGVAMCCGLRSGDFGRICVSTFVQPDTGNYITIHNVDDDKRMVMTRTNSKTLVNGLQRIPLPFWLAEWLMEYERDGRPHLMAGEDHHFLFVTPGGLQLEYFSVSENRGISRMPSVFALMRQLLPMKDANNMTHLRSIFFNSKDECDGSILDLLGRADRFKRENGSADRGMSELPLREESDRLFNIDDTKNQMAFLNMSSVQQMDRHYGEHISKNIPQLLERLDHVKQYVFRILDSS